MISSLVSVSTRLNTSCPNQLNVASFCTAVDSKEIEPNPSHDSILYQYQTMIFNASCVVPGDSNASIRSKVQNFWNRYHDRLTCNMVNFNPRNGSILKLAVARQSDEFIDDSITAWQVGLNHIDSVDNGTVLDYIEQRKTNAGPTFARALQRYYDRFRAAGAKHRREL
ncbi:MAG: hypothetical protein V4598_07675 [Bdellovibrionota bacterium]